MQQPVNSIPLRYRENWRKAKDGSDSSNPRTGAQDMLPDTWLVLNGGVSGSIAFLSLGPRSLAASYLSFILTLRSLERSEKKHQPLPMGCILSSASTFLYY